MNERKKTAYFKHLEEVRSKIGINNCLECGCELKGEQHHFYCNRCWLLKKARVR